MKKVVNINASLDSVDFAPADELTEIIQNVRTILTTLKKTVPLDREFGLDAEVIDQPVGMAQAVLSETIMDAVQKYEPRVKVTHIYYEGDGQEGDIKVSVEVRINES